MPRCCATSIRCEAESLVQVIEAPCRSAMRSTSRLTETGSAMCAFGIVEHTSSTITSKRLIRGERRAFVVDDGRRFAVGVEHEAEIRSGRTDEVPEDLHPGLEVVDGRADRRGVGVDPQNRKPRSCRARGA